MSVLVVGLNHRSAPVALLERVSIATDALPSVLRRLEQGESVREAVVVSTCNRVEVYAEVERFHGGVADVSGLLAGLSGVPLDVLGEHLYVHYEDQAVLHLYRVACGLDSMVVGESQILGQLRRAYDTARHESAAGRVLHEVMQGALRVGKRAHAETDIDRAGQSLVSVGLGLAEQAVGSLAGRSVLVVGAGSMGALAGATLRRAGVGDVVVANRTPGNAERLAAALDGRGVGLDGLAAALRQADVVVSSTGATGQVLERADVEAAMAARPDRPLAVLDLALPRDVDPGVREVPGVTLVDLEALQAAAADTEHAPDVPAVERIVAEELLAFDARRLSTQVTPTITALRSRAAEVVDAELVRLAGRLPGLDPATRAEVDAAVRRVVDKLLHAPTVRVKELAGAPDGAAYAQALRVLFELDPEGPAAVARPVVSLDGGTSTTARDVLAAAPMLSAQEAS